MTVALVSMIELVAIGDLGQKRAGVFGEWVEEDTVNDDQGNLLCRY